MNTTGSPVSAKDYGAFLKTQQPQERAGWLRADEGDIVVIQPVQGRQLHGHIAMLMAATRLSIRKQRDMWGGPGLSQEHSCIRGIPALSARELRAVLAATGPHFGPQSLLSWPSLRGAGRVVAHGIVQQTARATRTRRRRTRCGPDAPSLFDSACSR